VGGALRGGAVGPVGSPGAGEWVYFTGICVFEAADEEAARKVMEDDPVVAAATPR